MAAYFKDIRNQDHVWHVDYGVPKLFAGVCTEVQADGHELEHIRCLESHMPEGEGRRVVTWVGTDAQWIYDTLTGK